MVSKPSGSVILRPVTSRMNWPLSVTSGRPSFSRSPATPPSAANWRISRCDAIGITSTGSGKAPRVSTSLDSSAMQTKRLDCAATIFSRVSAAPPPLTM